jgi:hypothetical protein
MRHFASGLHRKIASLLPRAETEKQAAPSKGFLEGVVLERIGDDIYINLGSDDRLLLGEVLEVLKPVRALTDARGDTLGWAEEPVATVRVRSVKSRHFSQATVEQEADSVRTGWTVRVKIAGE